MSSFTVSLSLVHRFDAPPERVAEAMIDPALPAFLQAHHEMLDEAADVTRVERGAVVERKVRFLPRASVERLGPKKIPREALAFVEESTFDRRTLSLEFEQRSTRARLRDRVVHRGTTTLRAIDGGTERRIDATLEVFEVPFALRALAGLAARVFRAEAERLFDGEAQCLRAFLAAR
jgi:Protein of unknown function (DUF2505)